MTGTSLWVKCVGIIAKKPSVVSAVFYNLSALATGDLVRLRDDRGAEVVYQVTDNFQVDPRDPASMNVMLGTPNDVITIITCGGTFFSTGGDYIGRRW